MNYKDEYNEWAQQVFEETGTHPDLDESEGFRCSYVGNLCDLGDELRKMKRLEESQAE